MQRANYARGLRFLPIVAFITTVGLISAFTNQASAQNVYTDPVGFITLNATGTYSFVGIAMTQVPVQRGVAGTVSVSADGSTVIPLSGLNAGSYNYNADGYPAYYIEDLGSNNVSSVGFSDDIASNDNNNVYTVNNDSAYILTGDNVKIYPHQTLDSLFGTNNQAGVVAPGTGSTVADQVIVWNPAANGGETYWYRTNKGWRGPAGNTVDAGMVPLYVDQGLEIFRQNTTTNCNFQVVGAVKLGPTQTYIPYFSNNGYGGYAFVAGLYATSLTFTNLNLYTGNLSTGVQSGTGASAADQIVVWNPVEGGGDTYWYRTNKGWRGPQGSTVDAGTNVIPMGSVFQIERINSQGFTWTLPAQY
jgi:hypothetical protein